MTQRKMWYISKGSQSEARFDLLISLTGLRSESMRGALRDYLVRGIGSDNACELNSITNKANFDRDLAKLNAVAEIIEKIKEIDYK